MQRKQWGTKKATKCAFVGFAAQIRTNKTKKGADVMQPTNPRKVYLGLAGNRFMLLDGPNGEGDLIKVFQVTMGVRERVLAFLKKHNLRVQNANDFIWF